MRPRRHIAGAALQDARRTLHLNGDGGEFVRFALHGLDQQREFVEHAVEAALEKPQFVGVPRLGTRMELSTLDLRHAFTGAPNARDQLRRHLDHLLRHDQQHHGCQEDLRPRHGIGGMIERIRIARDDIPKDRRTGGDVAERRATIERVRHDGQDVRQHQHRRAEQIDHATDQQRIEDGEYVAKPPAIPAFAHADRREEPVEADRRAE